MNKNGAPTTFADIAHKQRTRGNGCAICGEKPRGLVSVQLQAYAEGKATLTGGKRVRSKSVSLCEAHCVAVYWPLEGALLRATGLEHLIGVPHE